MAIATSILPALQIPESKISEFATFGFDLERQWEIEYEATYLTPLRSVKHLKRRKFYAFDSETKDGLKGTQLFCYCLSDSSNNLIEECCRSYSSSKNFEGKRLNSKAQRDENISLKHLFNYFTKTQSDVKKIIYVHNLSFDIRFLLDFAAKNGIKFHIVQSGSSVIACIFSDFNVKFVDTRQ
jgi:hypothetical protein